MKYSAVLAAAAFAAGAVARAVPAEQDADNGYQTSTDQYAVPSETAYGPAGSPYSSPTDTAYPTPTEPTYSSPPASQYPVPTEPSYSSPSASQYPVPTNPEYSSPSASQYPVPTGPAYSSPSASLYPVPTEPSYPVSAPSIYAVPTQPSYQNNPTASSYAIPNEPTYDNAGAVAAYNKYQAQYPVPQKAYEDNEDAHHYGPVPVGYKKEDSCFKDIEYATNVYADEPCPIKWQPREPESKPEDIIIYVYRCDDYNKPYETICDDCGQGVYDQWKPKDDCQPSDAEGGSMYRFKFCKKDDETKFTWSAEFAIYNVKYYEVNTEVKRVESQCPPPLPAPVCPTDVLTLVPTPAPTSEAAPESEAAPVAASAPIAASAPVSAPAAPPSAPSYNRTAPVAPEYPISGSSAIHASISLIVGLAAVVSFIL